jgi:hypothetical protein
LVAPFSAEIQSQLNADIAPLGAHSGSLLITSLRAERIMSKISNPIWSLFATALLLGINLSLQSARSEEADSSRANATDSASADNCLAAPTATPKGQHWYYRTERQKGRKCWSLHEGGPVVHHTAARPHSKAATSAGSAAATHNKPAAPEEAVPPTNTQDSAFEVAAPPPAPTHPQPAPEAAFVAATWPDVAAEAEPGAAAVPFAGAPQNSAFEVAAPPPAPTHAQPAPEAASVAATWPDVAAEAEPGAAAVPFAGAAPAGPADGVRPQPHVQILRTEPVGVPTHQAAQPSAPAAQVAPDAQAAQPSAPAAQGGSTAAGNATSTDSADTVRSNAGSAAKDAAVPEVGPDAERGESDAAQRQPAETAGLAEKIATLQPTELFILLAIGLSTLVFLVAIASRIVAKRREPIITEYADPAWSNDHFHPPRLEAPQFADEAMDEQRTDEERDVPFIDPQGLDDPHQQQSWIKQPALTSKSTGAFSAPSAPDPKSLEPVLRILRQS